MTKLIILIVVVLGVFAITQLVRLYELSSKLNGRREEDIPNRENKLNAALLFAFMLFMFGGFIWLMLRFGWTGRGEAASESGAATDVLLNLNFVIIIAVFFITNFLLFGFAFKYVRKPGVKANWFPHSNKLELLWTMVPAVVLAFIIILGLISWNKQTSAPSKDAQVIELYSKQFDWTVRMAGDDNKLGFFDYKLTNSNNPLALMTKATIQDAIDSMESGSTGIKALETKLNNRKLMFDPKNRAKMIQNLGRQERLVRLLYQMRARHDAKLDKAAMDDIVFGANDTLYLCKGREVEFNFRSKDVIHSALFPHFRAQMNTVPGMTTRFKFKPTITTVEMRKKMHNSHFNFVLMCNKICGSSHYKMKLIVVVLEPEDYKVWYHKVSKLNPAAADVCRTFKNVYPVGKPKKVEAAATDSIPAGAPAPMMDSVK
jgi:cytochrome c oxidase subunit 2